MEAKFLKRLSDYKYALVCDLAQYESGFALLDVSTNALIEVQQISVSRTTDQPTGEMYQMFDQMVNDFLDRYSLQAEDLIIIKEQLPINCGPHSTAQTLQALAAAHAVFNINTYLRKLYTYSNGIHSISVKTYFKKLLGIEKPQKDDIRAAVCKYYDIDPESITRDESDAIALWFCLCGAKWNKDIDDQIKLEKKHRKTLTANHAIKDVDNEIERLEGLKWDEQQFTTQISLKLGLQSVNQTDNQLKSLQIIVKQMTAVRKPSSNMRLS